MRCYLPFWSCSTRVVWFNAFTIYPRKAVSGLDCLGEYDFGFKCITKELANKLLVYHNTTCSPK